MNSMSRVAIGASTVPTLSGASRVSRPMSASGLEIDPPEECVIVGGCGGLLLIPAAQQSDYYRAQRYVAILGVACLLAFLLFF